MPRAARRSSATGAACSPRGGSAARRPSGAAGLREGLPPPGRAADGPADPGAQPGRRTAAGADRGMAGIRHARKGAGVRIPHEAARAGPRARAALRKLQNELGQGRHLTIFRRINAYNAIGGVCRGAINGLGRRRAPRPEPSTCGGSRGRSAPQGPAGRDAGRAARGGGDPAAEGHSGPS